MLQIFLALVSCLLLLSNVSSFSPFNLKSVVQQAAKVVPKFRSNHLVRMAVTEAPPKSMTSGGGFFTNSSPETKRVVPVNMDGKTKFKIVYVVLESQYQSSLTKACNDINAGNEGVAVEAVGYLLEELRNPAVFEQFKADVGDANIFIGSLIFIQELADKVRLGPSFFLVHCQRS